MEILRTVSALNLACELSEARPTLEISESEWESMAYTNIRYRGCAIKNKLDTSFHEVAPAMTGK